MLWSYNRKFLHSANEILVTLAFEIHEWPNPFFIFTHNRLNNKKWFLKWKKMTKTRQKQYFRKPKRYKLIKKILFTSLTLNMKSFKYWITNTINEFEKWESIVKNHFLNLLPQRTSSIFNTKISMFDLSSSMKALDKPNS